MDAKAVTGHVELHDEEWVTGWAHRIGSTEPLPVTLYVDEFPLYAVRADLRRPDLVNHFRCDVGGFRFRIGPRLRSVLPDGSKLRVVAESKVLPFHSSVPNSIVNPDCKSLAALQAELERGLRISAKSGDLYLPVNRFHGGAERILESFEYCRTVMKSALGWDLLLGYGTLLGAVRDGDFIAHDDDIDAIFYVPTRSTAEAVEQFRHLCATFTALDEQFTVIRSGQLHWRALKGRGHNVDIFMGWFDNGTMYSYAAGGIAMTPEDVSPLLLEFKGQRVQVPREFEKVLESTYGTTWRVPDPLFQWRIAPAVAEAMANLEALWSTPAIAGAQSANEPAQPPAEPDSSADAVADYWNHFYQTWNFAVPSQFAAMVAADLNEPVTLLELGCGNGRDAVFFARHGHRVLALDASEEAVRSNRAKADELGLCSLSYECAKLGTPNALQDIVSRLAQDLEGAKLVVYARFFFHAIPDSDQSVILRELAQTLPAGSRCFFEFRSSRDVETPKVFGSHYRRYIDTEEFSTSCERMGLHVLYCVTGQGMARFRDEDPWVSRVFVRKPA